MYNVERNMSSVLRDKFIPITKEFVPSSAICVSSVAFNGLNTTVWSHELNSHELLRRIKIIPYFVESLQMGHLAAYAC